MTISLFFPYLSNPHIIVCSRDPKAVAKSLEVRDHFSIAKGLKLNRRYRQYIDVFLSEHPKVPRLLLDYEVSRASRYRTILRLVIFLRLRVTKEQVDNAIASIFNNDALKEKKKEFINK